MHDLYAVEKIGFGIAFNFFPVLFLEATIGQREYATLLCGSAA